MQKTPSTYVPKSSATPKSMNNLLATCIFTLHKSVVLFTFFCFIFCGQSWDGYYGCFKSIKIDIPRWSSKNDSFFLLCLVRYLFSVVYGKYLPWYNKYGIYYYWWDCISCYKHTIFRTLSQFPEFSGFHENHLGKTLLVPLVSKPTEDLLSVV